MVAVTTGEYRPDGRILAPAMPWRGLSHLAKSDALAIVAFLKSIAAVKNEGPGPFGPDTQPSVLVMSVVPGEVYAGLAKPK